jgi:hypothetical protein
MDPTDVPEYRLRQLLTTAVDAAHADRPAWRILVDGVAGVSPPFAPEVVFRATG